MSDERRSNVGGERADERHRRHSKSHRSRERHDPEIDGSSPPHYYGSWLNTLRAVGQETTSQTQT